MIKGTGHSKFTRGGTITVDLLYSTVTPEYALPEQSIQKGLKGDRFVVNDRDYAEFTVRDNLFKYPDKGISKLNEIQQYRGQLVEFYPHADGPVVSRNFGAKLFFWITSVTPFKIFDNYGSDHAVIIKFVSKIDTHPFPQQLSGFGTGFGFNHGFNQ